jgi:hypothetical protein
LAWHCRQVLLRLREGNSKRLIARDGLMRREGVGVPDRLARNQRGVHDGESARHRRDRDGSRD